MAQRHPRFFLLLLIPQLLVVFFLCRDFVLQGKLLCSPEVLDMSLPWARSLDAIGWRLDQALWDRNSFCGIPFLANPSLRTFYPPDLFLRLFTPISPEAAFSWLILCHMVFLGLGGALWISRYSRSLWVMNLGGWLLLLNGYITARTGLADPAFLFATTWMPWILYALPAVTAWWGKIVLIILLVLEILAGRPDVTFFFAWCLAAWWLVVWGQRFLHPKRVSASRNSLYTLISAVAISLLITSIQLLPTFELQQHTLNRSGDENFDFLATDSMVPGLFLASLFPGIFGDPSTAHPDKVVGSPGSYWGQGTGFHEFYSFMGQGTLLLLLAGLSSRRTRLTAFWVLVVLFSLLFAFGKYAPVFGLIVDYIPGWNRFRVPPRILILFVLGVVWLACQGFDQVVRNRLSPLFFRIAAVWIGLVFLAAFAVSLGVGEHLIAALGPENLNLLGERSQEIYQLMLSNMVAALCLAGVTTLILLLCLWVPSSWGRKAFGVILLLDLAWHNGSFLDGKKHEEIALEFPQDPLIQKYRDSGETGRLLTLATVMNHQRRELHPWFFPGRLFDYAVENVGGYGPFLLEDYVRAFQQLDLRQKTYNNGLLLFLFQMDSLNQALFNLFQVSHVISPDRPIRGFSVEAFHDYTAPDGTASRLFLSRNPVLYPRAFLFRESPETIYPKPEPSLGTCHLVGVSSTAMLLSASATSDCQLAILETWFPGWQAQVNGKEQPIEKLAGTFRRIPIPKGTSTISLTYSPFSWHLGIYLSVLGLLAAACVFCRAWRKPA